MVRQVGRRTPFGSGHLSHSFRALVWRTPAAGRGALRMRWDGRRVNLGIEEQGEFGPRWGSHAGDRFASALISPALDEGDATDAGRDDSIVTDGSCRWPTGRVL